MKNNRTQAKIKMVVSGIQYLRFSVLLHLHMIKFESLYIYAFIGFYMIIIVHQIMANIGMGTGSCSCMSCNMGIMAMVGNSLSSNKGRLSMGMGRCRDSNSLPLNNQVQHSN